MIAEIRRLDSYLDELRRPYWVAVRLCYPYIKSRSTMVYRAWYRQAKVWHSHDNAVLHRDFKVREHAVAWLDQRREYVGNHDSLFWHDSGIDEVDSEVLTSGKTKVD